MSSEGRRGLPKHVEWAIRYGLIHEKWTLEDYLIYAVDNQGYETVGIHGVQSSGKSCRMLQTGFWIFKDWDKVLSNIIFKPSTFVQKLQAIPIGRRVPWIGFDDIGVHYPSSRFRTDIKQYEAIDSAWAAIRTKCSVVVLTIPLLDRLAKNIKDNVTFEVYLGRNQTEIVERIVRMPSFDRMETRLCKILVEGPRPFDLYEVPKDVFKEYWEMRLKLTEEALEGLAKATDLENTEGYTMVLDVAEKLHLSPNTIQQMESRGVIKGRKIDGLLYINDEYITRLKRLYDKGELKATARGI